MSSTDAVKAKEVFGEALNMSGLARLEYLDQACSGNEALRDRILKLLESAERPDAFLQDPTLVSQSLDWALTEKPGTRIGPYKILQLIGEGGFGSVFMAEQTEPVHRRVALKIIKLGMDTRQVVARFEAERQALAMMDHPHIAKVLDGGATQHGRPYFVMDLVAGDPITKYCDRHNLPIEARLTLLLQVCEAIQHAHVKGIIHRDLKPTNILVSTQDGRPFAKVIDFGIAKATASRLTEKTLFTEHRAMIGTPEYMSPEQAEGGADIDTRTDIYALGVLMYELLTGTTPFQGKDLRSAAFGEIQRIIREVEPPKPSTRITGSRDTLAAIAAHRKIEPRRLGTLVKGDLDWIVMKALDKDRARRYDTASAMALDLRRHLDGQPVSAAPPSLAYQARKFFARHRGKAIAAAFILIALFAGAIATSVYAVLESRARARAEIAEASSRQRATELEAVAQFQDTQLRDIDPATLAIALRNDILAEARTSMAAAKVSESEIDSQLHQLESLLARPNLTNVTLKMLDTGLFDRSIKAVHEQFKDQPLVRARLLQTLSATMTQLGILDRALPPQSEALAIRRRELGNEHPDTLSSVGAAAELYRQLGKMDQAEPLFTEAFDVAHRVLGDNHRVTLSAVNNMGALLGWKGKLAQAEELQLKAVEMSKAILGPDHPDTAGSLSNLAFTLASQNQVERAVELMREALAIRRKSRGELHEDTLESVNNLGFMLQEHGQAAEAEKLFRDAYDGRRTAFGDDHPATLRTLNNIGSSLRAQGKYVEAEATFRKALEAHQRVFGADHGDTIIALSNLGVALAATGKPDDALPFYREAYERRFKKLGPDNPETLKSMSNMGSILADLNQLDESESISRRAYESRRRLFGPDNPETLVSENNLAYILQRLHRFDEAEPLFREVLEKRRKSLGPSNPRTLTSMQGLGSLLLAKGDLPEAETLLKEALDGRITVLKEQHPLVADTRYLYAKTLMEQSKFAQAEQPAILAAKASQAQAASAPKATRNIQLVVDLYTRWHTADPNQHHDEQAQEWKKQLPP